MPAEAFPEQSVDARQSVPIAERWKSRWSNDSVQLSLRSFLSLRIQRHGYKEGNEHACRLKKRVSTA